MLLQMNVTYTRCEENIKTASISLYVNINILLTFKVWLQMNSQRNSNLLNIL